MCVHVFLLVCMCTTCMQYPRRPEEDIGSLETGVPGGGELPRGCWGLDLGHLEEQPLLLTTEPSLQLYFLKIFICMQVCL